MCISWCHEWITKVRLSDFTQKMISVLITWIQCSLLSNLFVQIKYMYFSCHICPNKCVPYVQCAYVFSSVLYCTRRYKWICWARLLHFIASGFMKLYFSSILPGIRNVSHHNSFRQNFVYSSCFPLTRLTSHPFHCNLYIWWRIPL